MWFFYNNLKTWTWQGVRMKGNSQWRSSLWIINVWIDRMFGSINWIYTYQSIESIHISIYIRYKLKFTLYGMSSSNSSLDQNSIFTLRLAVKGVWGLVVNDFAVVLAASLSICVRCEQSQQCAKNNWNRSSGRRQTPTGKHQLPVATSAPLATLTCHKFATHLGYARGIHGGQLHHNNITTKEYMGI